MQFALICANWYIIANFYAVARLLGVQPRRGCRWWGVFGFPHIVAYGANAGLFIM